MFGAVTTVMATELLPSGPVRLAALVDRLRPSTPADIAAAEANVRAEAARLARNPAEAEALARDLGALLSLPGAEAFFAEAGVRSALGFSLEVAQRIARRLLPPVPDPPGLPEALDAMFRDSRDHLWVAAVSTGAWLELAVALRLDRGEGAAMPHGAVREALSLLSYRLAGAALDRELMRAVPALLDEDSPFLAQNSWLQPLLERARREGVAPTPDELRGVLDRLEECRASIERVHWVISERGVSIRLSYLLHRLRQMVDRLDRLLRPFAAESFLPEAIALSKELLAARQTRHEVISFTEENLSLLALNVTESASRRGEHYIAESRREWLEMGRSAAGGGVVIALMAFLKIRLSLLHLPPLAEALAVGLNYGLGFVLIHLLGFTVATKQPAMTAATLAAGIEGATRDGGERFLGRVRSAIRTQFLAILGNVGLALPVAMLVVLAWSLLAGEPPCPPAKAEHLLSDLDPVHTGALVFAAIAGVGLFLSGLVSGFFDNQARYHWIPARVSAVARRRGFGEGKAKWLGDQVDIHFGAVLGNLFFGLYLGFVGAARPLTGLPLDIRHVAFASANMGTAMATKGLETVSAELPWAVAGVVGIAFVNLVVSFSLALAVATRSRGLGAGPTIRLGGFLLRRFLAHPLSFLTPPPVNSGDPRAADRGH